MNTKNLTMVLLVLAGGLLLILGNCTKDDNPDKDLNASQAILKSGNGPSAMGQAFYHNPQGWERYCAFHAITKPNGTVEGNCVLTRHDPEFLLQVKFDIDCLSVNGNEAVMSGIVTASTAPLCPVGTPVVFRAIDNGEGGSDPDQMTGLYMPIDPGWGPWDCNNFPVQVLFDLEHGNIQVNP